MYTHNHIAGVHGREGQPAVLQKLDPTRNGAAATKGPGFRFQLFPREIWRFFLGGLGFRMRILAQMYIEKRWEVHTGFMWMNGVNVVWAFSQLTKVSMKICSSRSIVLPGEIPVDSSRKLNHQSFTNAFRLRVA